MSNICQITGKRAMVGNNISHSSVVQNVSLSEPIQEKVLLGGARLVD